MIYLIPARAGSKRLPGKNSRLLCGLPLWMWSLATARRLAGPDDYIVVSTDDEEIQVQARALNVPIHYRPPALATDTAQTIDVVYDLMDSWERSETVCVLQPTSPDRFDADVRLAVECALKTGEPVVGVWREKHSGAFYIYQRSKMPDVEWSNAHQYPGLASDIDTLEDFRAVESSMLKRNRPSFEEYYQISSGR